LVQFGCSSPTVTKVVSVYCVSLLTGILVCRSNRTGLRQINPSVNNLLDQSASKIKFIVNGVSINEIESVLGDLPKEKCV
jgi:hypothetical protein